ncbi:hypothetical protein HaLaN_17542 [Haematococcus lacustris]|uniref:Uncharacterized protein n=1 Tax=Haematococcus lacustris TaxID=44745 RepID=A0A699ZEX0_HAELA|nr:hypothetical protein HaLaN_17542 [Haematococcus lacustris]
MFAWEAREAGAATAPYVGKVSQQLRQLPGHQRGGREGVEAGTPPPTFMPKPPSEPATKKRRHGNGQPKRSQADAAQAQPLPHPSHDTAAAVPPASMPSRSNLGSTKHLTMAEAVAWNGPLAPPGTSPSMQAAAAPPQGRSAAAGVAAAHSSQAEGREARGRPGADPPGRRHSPHPGCQPGARQDPAPRPGGTDPREVSGQQEATLPALASQTPAAGSQAQGLPQPPQTTPGQLTVEAEPMQLAVGTTSTQLAVEATPMQLAVEAAQCDTSLTMVATLPPACPPVCPPAPLELAPTPSCSPAAEDAQQQAAPEAADPLPAIQAGSAAAPAPAAAPVAAAVPEAGPATPAAAAPAAAPASLSAPASAVAMAVALASEGLQATAVITAQDPKVASMAADLAAATASPGDSSGPLGPHNQRAAAAAPARLCRGHSAVKTRDDIPTCQMRARVGSEAGGTRAGPGAAVVARRAGCAPTRRSCCLVRRCNWRVEKREEGGRSVRRAGGCARVALLGACKPQQRTAQSGSEPERPTPAAGEIAAVSWTGLHVLSTQRPDAAVACRHRMKGIILHTPSV